MTLSKIIGACYQTALRGYGMMVVLLWHLCIGEFFCVPLSISGMIAVRDQVDIHQSGKTWGRLGKIEQCPSWTIMIRRLWLGKGCTLWVTRGLDWILCIIICIYFIAIPTGRLIAWPQRFPVKECATILSSRVSPSAVCWWPVDQHWLWDCNVKNLWNERGKQRDNVTG